MAKQTSQTQDGNATPRTRQPAAPVDELTQVLQIAGKISKILNKSPDLRGKVLALLSTVTAPAPAQSEG